MQNKISDKNIRSRLMSYTDERMIIFRDISPNNQGFILLTLPKSIQANILNNLKEKEIIAFLHYLDPDEMTDVLQNVSSSKRDRIIDSFSRTIKEKVEFLLKFNPKTAAGIMSLDYIEIKKSFTIGKVSKAIQDHEKRSGKFPTILIVDKGLLVGELSGHSLVLGNKLERVSKYLRSIPTIRFDKTKEEVLSLFRGHPHDKVIVLDDDDSILGVIYSDDLLRAIDDKVAKGLYDFAGVEQEENIHDTVSSKIKSRYKWLILNLATAFLAASVVGLFEDTISKFVLLAIYMPIVAGMGGNAGTQTLAVFVRGIALKEIELNLSAVRSIMNEIFAGAVNGLITGIIAGLVALLWNKSFMFGLVIAFAMVINLIIAGLFGAIVPLIMKRLGKDPATSATIFITTATDVFGFFVFLGLASLIL